MDKIIDILCTSFIIDTNLMDFCVWSDIMFDLLHSNKLPKNNTSKQTRLKAYVLNQVFGWKKQIPMLTFYILNWDLS